MRLAAIAANIVSRWQAFTFLRPTILGTSKGVVLTPRLARSGAAALYTWGVHRRLHIWVIAQEIIGG